MEVSGYVYLKSGIDCSKAMGSPDIWEKDIHRAMEINQETKSLLLIDRSATQMGMFELEDASLWFECVEHAGVICPIELKGDFLGLMQYSMSRLSRKGGYPPIVKQMVIAASLEKGKLSDGFLFQKQ